MNTLSAVNRLLRAIHEAPVAALDTGTSSVAGLAEAYLDEANLEIQSEGWAVNREEEISMTPVTVDKLVITPTTGFAWNATTLSLSKTGVFTAYTWAKGDQIRAVISGATPAYYAIASRTSADAVVLATALATGNPGGAVSAGPLGWENGIAVASDILAIDASGSDAYRNIVNRAGMLYDADDDTFSFGAALIVDIIRQLPFTSLPLLLQNYIILRASLEFQRRMTQGQIEDSFLIHEYEYARRKAMREEADTAGVNVLTDDHATMILGKSRQVSGGGLR